jgi:hypothetical protein
MMAIVAMFKWFSNWQSLFVVVLSAGWKMRHWGLEVRGANRRAWLPPTSGVHWDSFQESPGIGR